MSKDEIRLGPMRAEVLHRLREVGAPMAVVDLAEAVGLHHNTARFHLDALVEHGLVHRETEARNRPGRPKVLYRAAHGHRPNRFQELAQVMIRHLAGPAGWAERAEAAGAEWGKELRDQECNGTDSGPLERLVGCMERLGYAPRLVDDGETRIDLTPCPYGDLAETDPAVVCRMHLGLASGLLGEGQPWQVTAIEPFVTPETCVVRLARTEAAEPAAAHA